MKQNFRKLFNQTNKQKIEGISKKVSLKKTKKPKRSDLQERWQKMCFGAKQIKKINEWIREANYNT